MLAKVREAREAESTTGRGKVEDSFWHRSSGSLPAMEVQKDSDKKLQDAVREAQAREAPESREMRAHRDCLADSRQLNGIGSTPDTAGHGCLGRDFCGEHVVSDVQGGTADSLAWFGSASTAYGSLPSLR